MMTRVGILRCVIAGALMVIINGILASDVCARDVEYSAGNREIPVWVNEGEPTEIIYEGGRIKD